MKASVLAYGSGWVAIDKPFDLSVHNADSSQTKYDCVHLVKDLLKSDTKIKDLVKPEKGFNPSPVHRLDVGTSGVLLFALSSERAKSLALQFSDRTSTKTYLAVLKGRLAESHVDWKFSLTDKAEGRRDPAGSGDKKECHTHVEVLQTNDYFTYAKIILHTGRTHQIRRHAVLAKHPVLGDDRYTDPKYVARISEIYGVDRLALHAHELTLTVDGRVQVITSHVPEFVDIFMKSKI